MHGMRVVRHAPVHGKTSLVYHDGRGVFAGLPSPFEAARYHSLVVEEESIPRGRDTEGCWAVSAWTLERDEQSGVERRVVMGLRRVWNDPVRTLFEGVQFHPESFMTGEGEKLLRNFLSAPTRNNEAGLGQGATTPGRVSSAKAP
jgi:anthranilate synthase component 2